MLAHQPGQQHRAQYPDDDHRAQGDGEHHTRRSRQRPQHHRGAGRHGYEPEVGIGRGPHLRDTGRACGPPGGWSHDGSGCGRCSVMPATMTPTEGAAWRNAGQVFASVDDPTTASMIFSQSDAQRPSVGGSSGA